MLEEAVPATLKVKFWPEIKSFPVFHEASDALIHFLDGLNEGSHCPACTPSQHSQPGEASSS